MDTHSRNGKTKMSTNVGPVDQFVRKTKNSISASNHFMRSSSGSSFSSKNSVHGKGVQKVPVERLIEAQSDWLADGTFNGRTHCDIFVNSQDLDTPSKSKTDHQIRELKGRLTNTVQAEAVLMGADDDNFSNDIGKQVAEQTYITLLIGDWVGALECLLGLMNLDPEDAASALEFKDEDGNTLMHRAVMSKDAPDIQSEASSEAESRQKRRGLKFEDNSDQVHREKIVERLFRLHKGFLLQQNNKGETPLECCDSNIMREHIRMLVRKRLVEKKSKTVGRHKSILGIPL